MPLYQDSSKVKDLYIGSVKIKKLYVGSTLVYQKIIPVGTTVFESDIPGEYAITIPQTRNYDIVLVGGGGGGGSACCGAGGALIQGTAFLRRGEYVIKVGRNGTGYISSTTDVTDGGDTKAFEQIAGGGNKGILLTATGGKATVTLEGLTGTNGKSGATSKPGASLYEGYGAGGNKKTDGTGGYIKIVTA